MKWFNYLYSILVLLLLNSCGNMTEEITIREDGSGEYKVYMDMIPMIRQMLTKMGAVIDTSDQPMDSLTIEDKIWKDFPDEVDSVFSYNELGNQIGSKDMPEFQDIQKLDGQLEGFMYGGREKGYLNIGMRYSFTNTKDLGKFFKYLENKQKKKAKEENETFKGLNMFTNISQSTNYKIKPNSISRNSSKASSPENEGNNDMTALMKLIGQGKVRTVVNLPRKITEVSGDNIIKMEEKTVIFEYPFIGVITDSVNTDFIIKIEK